MAKPFYCAVALMALSGCPSVQCPEGTSMVGDRCVDVDSAVPFDASADRDAFTSLDAFSPDAFAPPDAFSPDACVATTWFRDRDGDGYGNPADSLSACVAPDGYVAMDGDCSDANPAAHPGVVELCNRADDDCDGASDEGLTHIIGSPVVIPTDTFGANDPAGQVGILPYSAGHMLVWSEFFSGTRNIVSSALGNDSMTRVTPHVIGEGFPIALHPLPGDQAILLYQPPGVTSTQLYARRMSTVLGNATWVGEPVLIEDAPECCRVVTAGITRDRILITWRTEASVQTYARSCALDLTDCTPRVTLFTETAYVTGFAGDSANPIAFYAATLPGDADIHAYADRIDARTLAFENRPIRINATPAFPTAVANGLLGGTAAAIIATGAGARELVRFQAGTLGTDIVILGRTTLPPLANGNGLPPMRTTRSGFELVSDSGPTDTMPSNQVNWESFTQAGTATAPMSWVGPHPTSLAVTEGAFLRTEEGPPRLVFQRTGCE